MCRQSLVQLHHQEGLKLGVSLVIFKSSNCASGANLVLKVVHGGSNQFNPKLCCKFLDQSVMMKSLNILESELLDWPQVIIYWLESCRISRVSGFTNHCQWLLDLQMGDKWVTKGNKTIPLKTHLMLNACMWWAFYLGLSSFGLNGWNHQESST